MDAAFGEALIRLLPNLRRYAMSLARRADLADDLVQTTVERAIRASASYDPAARLEPWLFRITRNAFIDVTRRQRTQGVEVDVFDIPEALPDDNDRAVEARLMLRATQDAMKSLPPSRPNPAPDLHRGTELCRSRRRSGHSQGHGDEPPVPRPAGAVGQAGNKMTRHAYFNDTCSKGSGRAD